MYILEKKLCKTPADFGQISAGGLNFSQGWGPGQSLDTLRYNDLSCTHHVTFLSTHHIYVLGM